MEDIKGVLYGFAFILWLTFFAFVFGAIGVLIEYIGEQVSEPLDVIINISLFFIFLFVMVLLGIKSLRMIFKDF